MGCVFPGEGTVLSGPGGAHRRFTGDVRSLAQRTELTGSAFSSCGAGDSLREPPQALPGCPTPGLVSESGFWIHTHGLQSGSPTYQLGGNGKFLNFSEPQPPHF